MTAETVQSRLAELGNPDIAQHSQGFFKTGPGQYGEGDIFRGIRVPILRHVAKQHKSLSMAETLRLLQSVYHEDRFVALCILVIYFQRGDKRRKKAVYKAYLSHTRWINNWDLVDTSAHKIVGPYLLHRDRSVLYELVRSTSLWERRISILSTLFFIKKDDFLDTLRLSEILINDPHDLIHKAVGWMLREVCKRNFDFGDSFLREHYQIMPRTMLRYAIERHPEPLRKAYLEGLVI